VPVVEQGLDVGVPLQEIVLAILQPAPLACCRWELERRQMTPPSNFALRFIVEEDPSLVRQLNARYADAAPMAVWNRKSATPCSTFWRGITRVAPGRAAVTCARPGGSLRICIEQ
jgi:hypothetical protein